MSDVPERGRPETMTISESMKTRPHERRSDVDLEDTAKTEGGNHGHDEPVVHPLIGSAGPPIALGISDLDGLNRRVRTKWLLRRIEQNVRQLPTWPQPADAHEA